MIGSMANAMLEQILAHKRREVAAAKQATPFAELEAMVAQQERPRNLFAAVRPANGFDTRVIAEIKRKSPAAGYMRPEFADESFAPERIAEKLYQAGAAAIAYATDPEHFGGSLSHISRIKDAIPAPVLRKDFIIDPWQLWESRAAGADGVLLLAEALREAELIDLLILSQQLGLTAVVEVHDMDNLLRVRPHVGFPHPGYFLLAISNLDLGSLEADVAHTLRLADMVEDRSVLVSTSGIRTATDLSRLREVGVRIVLVGEQLMRADDPGVALRQLVQPHE